MPAALKGSHDILVHQNEMADSEGLDRIQDDDDLANKIATRQLVPLPASAMLRVDERLPENRRYCRPWVAKFLTDIARAHYARFHTPLQVNSAVCARWSSRTACAERMATQHPAKATPHRRI